MAQGVEPKTWMQCHSCQSPVTIFDNFCTNCGTEFLIANKQNFVIKRSKIYYGAEYSFFDMDQKRPVPLQIQRLSRAVIFGYYAVGFFILMGIVNRFFSPSQFIVVVAGIAGLIILYQRPHDLLSIHDGTQEIILRAKNARPIVSSIDSSTKHHKAWQVIKNSSDRIPLYDIKLDPKFEQGLVTIVDSGNSYNQLEVQPRFEEGAEVVEIFSDNNSLMTVRYPKLTRKVSIFKKKSESDIIYLSVQDESELTSKLAIALGLIESFWTREEPGGSGGG
jgi:hypothetical protein